MFIEWPALCRRSGKHCHIWTPASTPVRVLCAKWGLRCVSVAFMIARRRWEYFLLLLFFSSINLFLLPTRKLRCFHLVVSESLFYYLWLKILLHFLRLSMYLSGKSKRNNMATFPTHQTSVSLEICWYSWSCRGGGGEKGESSSGHLYLSLVI